MRRFGVPVSISQRVALALLLTAASAPARAEDTPERIVVGPEGALILSEPEGYRAAVDEAIAEFAAHRFGEARELFARAHAIFPNARTLRGLGLAAFELRDYVACVRHLEDALRSEVRPLDGDLRLETETLQRRAEGFVARLTLKSRPEASRLLVDGDEEQWPSRPLLLAFGQHTLELYASGYEPAKVSVFLSGGEERTLSIELQQPRRFDVSAPSPSTTHWYESPWLWAAVGVVVVAGGVVGVAAATSPSSQAEATNAGTSGVVIPGI